MILILLGNRPKARHASGTIPLFSVWDPWDTKTNTFFMGNPHPNNAENHMKPPSSWYILVKPSHTSESVRPHGSEQCSTRLDAQDKW